MPLVTSHLGFIKQNKLEKYEKKCSQNYYRDLTKNGHELFLMSQRDNYCSLPPPTRPDSSEHVGQRPPDGSSSAPPGTHLSALPANQPIRPQLSALVLTPSLPLPPSPGWLMPVLCTQVHAHQRNELGGRLLPLRWFRTRQNAKTNLVIIRHNPAHYRLLNYPINNTS